MYHTELISMRLPTVLLKRLDKRRGSASRAAYIRHLIEEDTAAYHREKKEEPEPPPVTPAPTPPATLVTKNTQTHYHRRGVRLDPPRWVQGQPVYSYRCSFEGCDHIME